MPMNNASTIADGTNPLDLFLGIGLEEKTARNTIANNKVTNNLVAVIHEAGLVDGCDRTVRNLLYTISVDCLCSFRLVNFARELSFPHQIRWQESLVLSFNLMLKPVWNDTLVFFNFLLCLHDLIQNVTWCGGSSRTSSNS
ncbi:Glutamine--tRNA ligase-like protein [Drosera capensis]